MSWENAMAHNRCNALLCTVINFRQMKLEFSIDINFLTNFRNGWDCPAGPRKRRTFYENFGFLWFNFIVTLLVHHHRNEMIICKQISLFYTKILKESYRYHLYKKKFKKRTLLMTLYYVFFLTHFHICFLLFLAPLEGGWPVGRGGPNPVISPISTPTNYHQLFFT